MAKGLMRNKCTLGVLAVAALLTAGSALAAERPEKCLAYENFSGREPAELRELCGGPTMEPAVNPSAQRLPTDFGYAQDVGYISDNFVRFTLNDFPGQTVIGASTNAYYGIDFDPTATILYALNDTSDELGTIDLVSGGFTALVAAPPPGSATNWTGLAIAADGTFWASTADSLYTLDPTTGVATLVGPYNITSGIMIAIAVDAVGNLYGHDMGTDSIYTIDAATGAATLVGATGIGANFAQGMDFDFSDGTLYIFAYVGSGANVFGTVDLATGAVTPLASSNPQGEFEGAIQVPASEQLHCNGPTVEFEDGIPLAWSNLDNSGPFAWVTTAEPTVIVNETGGAGEAATADADTFNESGISYDAELWTNPFSLATADAATLDYRYRYRNIDGGDFFDIDVSIDGGAGWTNLKHYTASNPGGGVGDADSIDLVAYAGESDVRLRFRYTGDGWDWYAQVDQIQLSCALPAVRLTKTVGTTPAVCAATSSLVVTPGTDVYYCYTVENTGTEPFDLHGLVDDQLGTLLTDFVYSLSPGASTEYIHGPVTINAEVTNTATWSADTSGGGFAASANASATVSLGPPNDLCTAATAISCPGGGGATSYLGTTIDASFTNQGTCTISHTAPEVWYHLVGNGGDMTVDTCVGTTWDTKISVWQGSCGALVCVSGNDDGCGLQSSVSWTSTLGTDYYVMVHGFSSSVGDFELSLTCSIPVELQSLSLE